MCSTSDICKVPVVFLIFRRPELTRQVFEKIRAARPQKLFVIADGPRQEHDLALCEQARAITEAVDWECEVLRNYAAENLGCRQRVSSGISWAFEHVEEAIILEDDCLPDPSFFQYCQTLLDHYRHDERVMVVSGDNFQDGQWRGSGSYYFSYYPHCWGWATWKRAWEKYDDNLSDWETVKDLNLLESLFHSRFEVQYWTSIFDQLKRFNEPDSWDYRWAYSCWVNSGMTILPNANLVKNIGFNAAGTHTLERQNPLANLAITPITQTLKHPPFMIRDHIADAYTFRKMFGGKAMSLRRFVPKNFSKWVKLVKKGFANL